MNSYAARKPRQKNRHVHGSDPAESDHPASVFLDGVLLSENQPGCIFRSHELASGNHCLGKFFRDLDQNSSAAVFKNSFKLAIIITVLQVLTSSFAAYPFAKMNFPGKDIIFLCYVATIAVPWQVYMIPQFIIVRNMHLADTHLSLILMQAFTAFGVFLMRQCYLGIPKELSEAARIDGLSEFGIYAKIMLPLSKPSIATLIIFTFVNTWNDYMGPMIYLNSNELKTIQLGLRMFITQYSADYNLIMAAALVSLIPVGVLFLSMQRFFIEGVASSGIKG